MGLALEVLEGEYKGRVFSIREGYRLGRTTGEIRIKNDPRISGHHATVTRDPRGGFILEDEESSNGLQINGTAVRRIKLLPGVHFIAGRTRFRVIENSLDSDADHSEPEKRWQDRLKDSFTASEWKESAVQNGFGAFASLLTFKFLEGVQSEHEVQIGFGPRVFGAETLDVELLDALSPPQAFEVRPTDQGPLLTTQFPTLVSVNGNHDSRCLLRSGDRIQVGNTLIEVRFQS